MIKEQVLSLWLSDFPPPDYYPYSVSTKPHLFISFDKFVTGRFHQTRSEKSYHTVQQYWATCHLSPICPRCFQELATFNHTILQYLPQPAKRGRLIPGLTSLNNIWTFLPLTAATDQYITVTKTGYPTTFSGQFPSSTTDSSDLLSDVKSI